MEVVGRDEELAALRVLLSDQDAALPRGILVEGDPGMGKTTLWRWAVDTRARTSRSKTSRTRSWTPSSPMRT